MSRRDTIIIAVLVNAGLLIVLFATALKTNAPQYAVAKVAPVPVQETFIPPMKKEVPFVGGDEVDAALHQYAQRSEPAAATPAHQEVNFADDLNAFAKAEVPPVAPVQTPSAPVAYSEKEAPAFIEIKVKKGDVLEKIARYHHTTVSEIMKINHLSTTNLRIGQVLKIANKGTTAHEAVSSPVKSAAPASENGPLYYIVKKGDNPWTIAVKNHMKVDELLRLNAMTEDQARRLKPGDQLRIR